MNNEDLIIKYRQYFCRNLIGEWHTNEGTFCLMADHFTFRPDGTGSWEDKDDAVKFNWREKADFEIEIQEIWASFGDEAALAGPCEWRPVRYDFKIAVNDLSEMIILYSNDRDCFYHAQTRITYAGKPPFLP